MMKCSKCGYENLTKASYCFSCGNPFTRQEKQTAREKTLVGKIEKAEEIRRAIATSIFIFNENNHLQLTVSQCVSEKKRSDINTEVVLTRAETALKKACKFTRNITVKA